MPTLSTPNIRIVHILDSTSKKHVDALHNVILFGIIRMFFTGNFKDCRNGVIVILEDMSNIIGNVLINQNNADIISRG